jgi:EmrB/QacA subfamily drug resistance transporter
MVVQSQHRAELRVPVLLILCGAPFLASLDLLIVNVAFAEIGRSFPGNTLGDVSWILNGYAIVYASLLIPAGRYADRVGHRRVFLTGLGLFTVASALAALSPSLWALVAFRVLQAAGAAAVTPTSLGLLLHAVSPEWRQTAVRIWATSGAVAAALGPLAGGLLVELSWHWVFLVNVPLGIALAIGAARTITDYRDPDDTEGLDLVGAALLAIGVGALATTLVRGPEWGWTATSGLTAGAVAVVALGAFALHNARGRSPLLSRELLRTPGLGWANVVAVLFNASFAGGILAMILFLQEGWGYSSLRTGLAVAPGPMIVPLFAFVGLLMVRRLSEGIVAAIGCLLWGAGILLVLRSVGAEPHYVAAVLPGWLISGVGVGLALPTILSAATAGLPPASRATGSAIIGMSRQLGFALGVALMIACLGTATTPSDVLDVFVRGWWLMVGIAVLAALVSPRLTARTRAPG